MKNYIKKLLRESLLKEIDFGEHSVDRLIQRFESFNDEDIPARVKQEVIQNLNLLKVNNLSNKTDYAVYLGGISQKEINKESIYYKNYLDSLKTVQHNTGRDRAYYSIGKGDEFFGDSTGNQFWLIVRSDRAATFMLRKDVQTQNSDENKSKLMVDAIIKNLPEWLKKRSEGNQPNNNKFKKIKLSNGKVIRHYEGLNKFETLEGTPIDIFTIANLLPDNINVDDIILDTFARASENEKVELIDKMPEHLQDKVMSLMESIELPIEIGDTVLMGKFKNKKVVVKTIDWDEEKGDLTINGKPALKVRIPKKDKE